MRGTSLVSLVALSTLAMTACTEPEADADGGVARDSGRSRRDAGSSSIDGSDGSDRSDGGNGSDGGPAPGPGCAGRSYLFCEDFESAEVGALPSGWSVGGGWGEGDPSVTDREHHSGNRALASAISNAGQHRAVRSIASLGAARGRHWGRVFYKVAAPAFVPSAGVVHNTMVGLIGSDECRVVDTVVRGDGAHQFLFNIPDDSCCVGSSYDYRSYDGAWHCAEWFVDADDQSYRFFFDGEEVTELAFSYGDNRRAHIEAFETIEVGWRNYQVAGTPYESWFDDLAIDDERIGCDP